MPWVLSCSSRMSGPLVRPGILGHNKSMSAHCQTNSILSSTGCLLPPQSDAQCRSHGVGCGEEKTQMHEAEWVRQKQSARVGTRNALRPDTAVTLTQGQEGRPRGGGRHRLRGEDGHWQKGRHRSPTNTGVAMTAPGTWSSQGVRCPFINAPFLAMSAGAPVWEAQPADRGHAQTGPARFPFLGTRIWNRDPQTQETVEWSHLRPHSKGALLVWLPRNSFDLIIQGPVTQCSFHLT